MSEEATRLGDSGETLLEVLIAMLIVSIVFVAVISGLATSIATSLLHKHQAASQTIARDFGEYLQFTSTYQNCGNAGSYASDASSFASSYTLPDGSHPLAGASPSYRATVTQVAWWNGSVTAPQFTTALCVADAGAQRFTIQVTSSSDSRINETLQVVKRKP